MLIDEHVPTALPSLWYTTCLRTAILFEYETRSKPPYASCFATPGDCCAVGTIIRSYPSRCWQAPSYLQGVGKCCLFPWSCTIASVFDEICSTIKRKQLTVMRCLELFEPRRYMLNLWTGYTIGNLMFRYKQRRNSWSALRGVARDALQWLCSVQSREKHQTFTSDFKRRYLNNKSSY